jgi:guanidinobutyrase
MIADAGDVTLTDATMLADVEKAVREELSRGLTPLVLGGDHSITLPVVRAVHRERGRFSILHFDAHPDLYPEFQAIDSVTPARFIASWKNHWPPG